MPKSAGESTRKNGANRRRWYAKANAAFGNRRRNDWHESRKRSDWRVRGSCNSAIVQAKVANKVHQVEGEARQRASRLSSRKGFPGGGVLRQRYRDVAHRGRRLGEFANPDIVLSRVESI